MTLKNLVTATSLVLLFNFSSKDLLAQGSDSRSSNIEFNALAIDEDRCPGVLVFPGTRSGSYNAYYYLVKPFPKMNIDFEDVAYIPSFKKDGDYRSFFYAFYFPSYNETNPFDEYADIPCSKEQLKKEIIKTLPASERPKPEEINLARLKINTLGFSIPRRYKELGFELVYDEALSDSQNAGVIYSKGTFVLELRIPEAEFQRTLEILRSEVGFPLTLKMGFKAKEQLDYKEVEMDIGSLLNELKGKLGTKTKYFSDLKIAAEIKNSYSFSKINIYGETANIDDWIAKVLIPLLSDYTKQRQQTTQSQDAPTTSSYRPPLYPGSSYKPQGQPAQDIESSEEDKGQSSKVYLDLSEKFQSDVKKFTFKSDILNPNASQEYLVYQYPLRFYGDLDGNYFVLESNRYDETERYSQIYMNAGDTLEFTVEGYWVVTPKLLRKKFYFTKENLESNEVPEIFTRGNPLFRVEKYSRELYILNSPSVIPGFTLPNDSKTVPYYKYGRVQLEPVSWGNGYFPKYFNWTPVFPGSSTYDAATGDKLSKSMLGTNLFDIKVPVNNLRNYSVEDLMKMIPLGIRFWNGKAIDKIFALSPLAKESFSGMFDEDIDSYFTISYNRARRTVILKALRSGHLYFENLDFVNPSLELRPKPLGETGLAEEGKDWRYITKDDFIKIDERLYADIEKKDIQKVEELAGKLPKGFLGLRLPKGVLPESWKPLQYDFVHLYPDSLAQVLNPSKQRISSEIFYPLANPKVEARTYIKLKIFDN